MKNRLFYLLLIISLLLPLTASDLGAAQSPPPLTPNAGITERVSVANDGSQADGFAHEFPSISAEGRYVAFPSNAPNLVNGDTNGQTDVFVRDRVSGTTERISVASDGAQADNYSYVPSISADGRYVAFISFASNLVSGDTNGVADIFLHDRVGGITQRVSVASDGTQSNGESRHTSISADGLIVGFNSSATNLVPGDTNSKADAFIHNLVTGTTERVSVASNGAQATERSGLMSISADGRYVAFESPSMNLAGAGPNIWTDIFLRDRLNQTTELVSIDIDGQQANSDSYYPSISADGRYVGFISVATDLVIGDTNGRIDVFVRDRVSGTTERVSIAGGGLQPNNDSWFPSISADGRYVAFYSDASNLVSGDTNAQPDVFLYDRLTQTTELISVARDGAQGNNSSRHPSISADGRYVAFRSFATNLVPGDTNGFMDAFVRDRQGGGPGTAGFLDLPFNYTNFEVASAGNTGVNPGRVNSWFDHTNPGWGNADGNLTKWNGLYTGGLPVGLYSCFIPQGTCYDAHDGIDFSNWIQNEPVLAAASGMVFEILDNCQQSPSGCSGFGNRVWVDHQNCYATLYAHLKRVDSVFQNAALPAPVHQGQSIGVIGNTGLSVGGGDGTHLHFGVYLDPSCDGDWSDKEPVDPFGWSGEPAADPWAYNPADSLWKVYSGHQSSIDPTGGTLQSSSATYRVDVPPGATSQTLTFDLLVESPVAAASAQLSSTGRAFWLRVLEWLLAGNARVRGPAADGIFDLPISVGISYAGLDMTHFDPSQLTIAQWNEIGSTWVSLPTTLNTTTKVAQAQTTRPGHFDLQAPLLCPADTSEIDDNRYLASEIGTGAAAAARYFDNPADVDWLRFSAVPGRQLIIRTLDLSPGVDTTLELYDQDGESLLLSNNDSGAGPASQLNWEPSAEGSYFLRLSPNPGSASGCSAGYQVLIVETPLIFLPLLFY